MFTFVSLVLFKPLGSFLSVKICRTKAPLYCHISIFFLLGIQLSGRVVGLISSKKKCNKMTIFHLHIMDDAPPVSIYDIKAFSVNIILLYHI